jgi:hypothetical protein
MEYFYLDKLSIPTHKQDSMIQLAEYLCLFELKDMIIAKMSSELPIIKSKMLMRSLKEVAIGHVDAKTIVQSSFAENLRYAMRSAVYADVIFKTKEESEAALASFGSSDINSTLRYHKAILSQCDYFAALFSSGFSEMQSCTSKSVLELSLAGLQDEGISISTFKTLVEYAYTGELTLQSTSSDTSSSSSSDTIIDLNEVVYLLAAANRLGFQRLIVRCQRELVTNLKYSTAESIRNCLVFARIYDFIRLERACLETLRLLNITEEAQEDK